MTTIPIGKTVLPLYTGGGRWWYEITVVLLAHGWLSTNDNDGFTVPSKFMYHVLIAKYRPL